MLIFFAVLVILASIILGLIVLVQNPKGGGLSGSLGGFSNQLMGVKQTTDILEKGTWVFAAIVGVLCLLSPAFIPKQKAGGNDNQNTIENLSTKPTQPVNKNTATPNNMQQPVVDSPKP